MFVFLCIQVERKDDPVGLVKHKFREIGYHSARTYKADQIMNFVF